MHYAVGPSGSHLTDALARQQVPWKRNGTAAHSYSPDHRCQYSLFFETEHWLVESSHASASTVDQKVAAWLHRRIDLVSASAAANGASAFGTFRTFGGV